MKQCNANSSIADILPDSSTFFLLANVSNAQGGSETTAARLVICTHRQLSSQQLQQKRTQRVFGNIERQIRQKEIILTPDESYETFRGVGTILRLGQDFDFYDWKISVKSVLKIPGSWHFQFNLSKRFMIRKDHNNRVAVKGEPNYDTDTINFGNVFKTGKTASDIEPTKLNVGAEVKPAKLQDINKLLVKHLGIEWRNRKFLNFFLNLLATDAGQPNDIPDSTQTHSSTETDDENTLMEEITDDQNSRLNV
ncbi:unnamed protein product [Pieris macdunnoughi]|uniref:Uncharacterized protein n=1 Tax=Pieris macdunnoughi TaxID=345717 RepID=A0A821UH31_9NEOP|nr:unnamed protein product [Pieris macdunnoughi]